MSTEQDEAPGPENTQSEAASGLADDGYVYPKSPGAPRRRLSDERRAITHHFSIAGQEGYITVGVYEDGSPGDIGV